MRITGLFTPTLIQVGLRTFKKYLTTTGQNDLLINKKVVTQSLPQNKWKETLLAVGFTENTSANLTNMSKAVIDNLAVPEKPNDTIKLPATLEMYIGGQLNK